ncbi:hypothetical protein [Priestia megaterium]|nr:hypothetical protein [Priestia megaterium]
MTFSLIDFICLAAVSTVAVPLSEIVAVSSAHLVICSAFSQLMMFGS